MIVTFLAMPSDTGFRDFLLTGPTLSKEELDDLESFINGFRRWKV